MNTPAKAVQDKIAPEGGGRTMFSKVLEGPLNCLCLNHNCSQIVVAGRNVFKVFSIEDDEFRDKVNLRSARNLNLNFSAADVVWNPNEENILASAATNGAVVTWNLAKLGRSKQDQVFQEHKRTVNRVVFHKCETHLLMSGAQDGFMKIFDLRTGKCTTTFDGKGVSVRDIQFHPSQYFQFAAGYENGCVQLWDMRIPTKWERRFNAHSDPVYALDFHPEEKNWVATAGRDRMIKVWDITNAEKGSEVYSIQCITSVARIKWRPQRKYHIASCSLLVDFSINVWDIRRPYIPFAAFNEHKDVVTGIQWKNNDPLLFYSSSKDSILYQHMFRDATRPADSANPVGLDIGLRGDLAHATSDRLQGVSANASPGQGAAAAGRNQPKLGAFFRKTPDHSEQFTRVSSLLSEFEQQEQEEDLSMEWFYQSAIQYKLTGKSMEELCEYNAQVATNLGRDKVAQTWQMLKLMYCNTPSTPTPTTGKHHLQAVGDSATKDKEGGEKAKEDTGSIEVKEITSNNKDKHKSGDTSDGHHQQLITVTDEESDGALDGGLELEGKGSSLIQIATGTGTGGANLMPHSDFLFGDGDIDAPLDFSDYATEQNGQEWRLQPEAFQLRQDLEERGNSPDLLDSPSSATDSDFGSTMVYHSAMMESEQRQELLMTRAFQADLHTDIFTENVLQVLKHYADRGDVQMSVSLMIVLGDKIRGHVNELQIEQWFMSYIDLLGRFQLWSVATEVIKLSKHHAVSALNQNSTTIHTQCSTCSKPLARCGWLCDQRCNKILTCSICHHPVKGVYVWCQGCSHGGHLDHIREWLKVSPQCPAGCGHLCEWT